MNRCALQAPTLSDIKRVRRLHYEALGRYPDLLRPRRFSEKIQWRKLFDLNPVYAVLADKIAAREFIAARVGAGYLPEMLWTGEQPEDIPFDTLEPPYILKCNHGSTFNIIVSDNAEIDRAAIREKLREWLAMDYGTIFHEPAYFSVKPQLLAERMLLGPDGTPSTEHKFFTFDGTARAIHSVSVNRDRERFDSFHDRDWRRLDWRGINPPVERELERPANFDGLLTLAEALGAGFDHMRVDLYDWRGEPRIGELTPYNFSGLSEFQPDQAELMLGSWWRLRFPLSRALIAMLGY